MERLTKSELINGFPVCYPKSDSGLPILVTESNPYTEIIKKLKQYEDLDEQGKLLKLPCAVGDTVYEVQNIRRRIQEYTITSICISNCGNLYSWELKDGKGVYSNIRGFDEYALGKTIFLTRKEAEAALKDVEHE